MPEYGSDFWSFYSFCWKRDATLKIQIIFKKNRQEILVKKLKKALHLIAVAWSLEVGHMYPNIVRVWKAITYNTAKGVPGLHSKL